MAKWNPTQSKTNSRFGVFAASVFGALMLIPFFGFTAGRVHAAEPAVEIPPPALDQTLPPGGGLQTVVLAGGCFWGVQAVFEHTKGVTQAVSGYAGGKKETAHYEEVGSGRTGHAESEQVTFDPQQISLGKILQIYFSVAHNPTELNYQGPDSGTQYRSAIFYANDEQKRIASAYIAQLNKAQGVRRADRDQARAADGLLSGRGLSPGLRRDASELSLHRVQRCCRRWTTSSACSRIIIARRRSP